MKVATHINNQLYGSWKFLKDMALMYFDLSLTIYTSKFGYNNIIGERACTYLKNLFVEKVVLAVP